MLLTPEGRARYKMGCEKCRSSYHIPEDDWYTCRPAGDRPINAETLNDPKQTCPEKKWDGLTPINPSDRPAIQREERLTKQTADSIALLKAFGSTIPDKDEDVRAELARLQDAGVLPARIAERVEPQLIVDREAARAAL